MGAPGQTITATGSGPAARSVIAARSVSPGTNRLSAPASAYMAARRSAAATPADVAEYAPVRNTSVRALIQTGTPSVAARAAASRSACWPGSNSDESRRSSMFTPTAPAPTTAATVAATASGECTYPASMSADTGTWTAAVIRRIAAATRSAPRSAPSGTPSDQATPALVVAIAFAPADAIATAEATSQALASSSGSPRWCRLANNSASWIRMAGTFRLPSVYLPLAVWLRWLTARRPAHGRAR